jgi:hypothetical protein
MSNRKLSKYLTEAQYTYSQTAKLKKLKNNLTTVAQFKLAVVLGLQVVDPIGNYYKIQPTSESGYRGPELNKAVKGVEGSDHCIHPERGGIAIDLNVLKIDPKKLFNDVFTGKIKQANGKPLKDILDQMIYEERHTKQGVQRWVHFGLRTVPRKEYLYTLNGSVYHTALTVIK